jgi:hypothetical protein
MTLTQDFDEEATQLAHMPAVMPGNTPFVATAPART